MSEADVKTIDLRGFQCPLPVLKTRHHLRKLSEGQQLLVLTDDPLATVDIPHFCNEFEQKLLSEESAEDGSHRFLIARQGAKI